MSTPSPDPTFRAARWLLANAVGFTIGGGLGGAVLRYLGQPHYGNVTSTAEAIPLEVVITGLGCVVFGLAIGTCQALALRGHLPFSRWLLATLACWVAFGAATGVVSGALTGTVSGMGVDRGVAGLVVAAVVGAPLVLVPGLGQARVLRASGRTARGWPLRVGLGLVAGFTVAFVVVRWFLVDVIPWLTDTDFPSARALTAVGFIAGVVFAATTAGDLARRLGSQVTATQVAPTREPSV
jgi:hypothetical protein